MRHQPSQPAMHRSYDNIIMHQHHNIVIIIITSQPVMSSYFFRPLIISLLCNMHYHYNERDKQFVLSGGEQITSITGKQHSSRIIIS
jgi:hypothetical protein